MYSVLPPWLSAFRRQYPEVELTLQEATTTEQLEGLQAHRLDIGFVRPPVSHNNIGSKTVWQEPLLVALPEAHPLSQQDKVAIAHLANEEFILTLRPSATDLYDKIMAFCQQANFSPNVVQTAEQLQTVLGLVAAQLGIAILPAAAQKLRREGVCYRQFVEATPNTELVMIWRAEDCSAVLENFLTIQP